MIRYAPGYGRLGTVMPCCDPSMSFFDQLLSNSCQWCTTADYNAQQTQMASQGTTGVPCCDPSNGIIANLLSNTCNVCNPIGDAIGLSSIPTWAWLAGAGLIAVLLLKGKR